MKKGNLSPNYVHVTFEDLLTKIGPLETIALFLTRHERDITEVQESFQMMNLLTLEGDLTMTVCDYKFDVTKCQTDLSSEIIRFFKSKEQDRDLGISRLEKVREELARHTQLATLDLLKSAEVSFMTHLRNFVILDQHEYTQDEIEIGYNMVEMRLDMHLSIEGKFVRAVKFHLVGDRQL